MNVRKFLWDYKAADEDIGKLSEDPEFLARVLSFGSADEARELIETIGKERIVAFLRAYGYKLDERSLNYWRLRFNLPRELLRSKRPFDESRCWKPF